MTEPAPPPFGLSLSKPSAERSEAPSLSPNGFLDLRHDFPGVGDWHYLDSAATAQKPNAVIEAIARAYGPDYATVHRGVYERSATMTLAYEDGKSVVKARRGCERVDHSGSRILK